jgi:two-component system cell cycle sensor histidine kinase/response regulator CckA
MHILLVDDEETARKACQMALESQGFTVTPAASGPEACELAQDGADLLIADVAMPGMSGKDLAATLQPRFPSMKVLFISGYEQFMVGTSGPFLQKPFNRKALVSKVRQVLGREKF